MNENITFRLIEKTNNGNVAVQYMAERYWTEEDTPEVMVSHYRDKTWYSWTFNFESEEDRDAYFFNIKLEDCVILLSQSLN